jgi:hypothetical protein
LTVRRGWRSIAGALSAPSDLSPAAHVERLCARLAATPALFFAATEATTPGAVHLEAVVADLFRDRATRPLARRERARLVVDVSENERERMAHKRHRALVLIASWLLHDDVFAGSDGGRLVELLAVRLRALAQVVMPRSFVDDVDRREELVRVVLHALGIAPAGETKVDADDRLASLDSLRRAELLRQAKEREEERERARREVERLRREQEEAARQAARSTYED